MSLTLTCPHCKRAVLRNIHNTDTWECAECGSTFQTFEDNFTAVYELEIAQKSVRCPKCGHDDLEPAMAKPEFDWYCRRCVHWFNYTKPKKPKVIARAQSQATLKE